MEAVVLGVDADSLAGATRLYESVGFVERKRVILYRRPLQQTCVVTVGQKQSRPAIRVAFAIGRPMAFGDRKLTVGFASLKQISSLPNARASAAIGPAQLF